MAEYIISSFRGGISDENDKGIAGSFKHGHALDIHSRDDVLKAKQAMATVFDVNNTTQVGIINFFVNGRDGTTYCFGSTGSIFARSGDGTFTHVYDDENGAIKGATEWELSDGNNYLYWATGTSIGRKLLQGADVAPDSGQALWTDADQDHKTTLDLADWHTMRQASGELMIANGNYLATVDIDGNFVARDLNVRPGHIVKTLEERDDYVTLGSGKQDNSEEGHIWSWITTAINWVQKKRVPVKGINSLITAEFPILQGGSDGEIFLADFQTSTPLHAVPEGGQSNPDGVAIEDDLPIFGMYGGTYPGLWSYGRRRLNRPNSLNYCYRLAPTVAGSIISTISAVTVIDGTLLASWGTTDGSTSDYGVDSVSSTTKATALYEGLEFDGGIPHLKKIFDAVKVTFAPLPSGCSFSVKYKGDKATTSGDSSAGAGWKYAVLGGGSTTFSTADETEAIFIIKDNAKVFEIGLELNPSDNNTPQVYSVVTYIPDETQKYA